VRGRLLAAVAVTLTLAIGAASAAARPAAPAKSQADKLTVWLMGDAQANWPEAVAAATSAFKQQHAGVDVDVQYQSWGDYKTKFEATLAGGSGPDVIEFGNTDVPKYSAAGALAPLTRGAFPNSRTWLSGLAAAGSFNGRLYAVPYYAGARAVIYRTDQYRAAGIRSTPKTLAEFNANGLKLMKKYGKDKTYSAVYFPGRYWYAAMSFVYDWGGRIATFRNGRWVGTLNEGKAIAAWRNTARLLSKANKTGNEASPQQALVFAKGKVGSFIGNGWEWPYALDPKVGTPRFEPPRKVGMYRPFTWLGIG
jgi:N,N'-diacetylchitobiose transport system substrate-binding protein